YPASYSDGRFPDRAALALTKGVFPSAGLARYEWLKHGTCTGLSPYDYFTRVRRARMRVTVPDALQAPDGSADVSPRAITDAFVAANPGLTAGDMSVGCHAGELVEVRVCLDKSARNFVACDEVARGTCRTRSIRVAPPR
ncbi:MAG: ribonuclease T, partial [Hyphomicrobiales bacterium]|nr:ribonuclease T [Hyphomicrobiales bacterium]